MGDWYIEDVTNRIAKAHGVFFTFDKTLKE